ncbi:sugar transferase [Streptomyces mirabilis]|uniref:sugar transferase n=1 Tax=Streptomyces mirabilis TaxID=68239 RepID=UPI0033E8F22B
MPVVNVTGVTKSAPAPHRTPTERPTARCAESLAKRTIDLLLATVMLLAALPLFALISLAVSTTSRGPVVFRQIRLGLDGQPFSTLKFRTMRCGSHGKLQDLLHAQGIKPSICAKPRHDPRITVVGRVLRKTSLDEIPQLLNVLRGDMSLVGPRPNVPEEIALLSWAQKRRLSAKPGMTGLWQVSGRSSLQAGNAVRLDLQYIDCWSLRLDLLILLRTVPAVFQFKNAR